MKPYLPEIDSSEGRDHVSTLNWVRQIATAHCNIPGPCKHELVTLHFSRVPQSFLLDFHKGRRAVGN